MPAALTMAFAPTSPLQHRLMSIDQAATIIRAGHPCCVSGDLELLRRLPRGCWIGGTIPYFMTERGGLCTRDEVFVTQLPDVGVGPRLRVYDRAHLQQVCIDGPAHGFTLLVLPAFSAIHEAFAQEAPGFPEMYLRPLVGWVAGSHLDDVGRVRPQVFDGSAGQAWEDAAVALHVPVPTHQQVHLDIVNLFEQGDGPVIRFPSGGFEVDSCLIDGAPGNLHDWLLACQHDSRLPLVTDCCGALVNVSLKQMDAATRRVAFYAPVFPETDYRLARPMPDYVQAFGQVLASQQMPGQPIFACNCILNHVHGGLQGRYVPVYGPATFGEIAYQLLNQTLVYLSLVDS